MQLQTISDVSKAHGVSTRTLRYYEQVGLLHSTRRPGYAYRVYDAAAQTRLAQILLLRKLRFSLAQIGALLQNKNAVQALELFRQNMAEVDGQMQALAVIRAALAAFTQRLNEAMPAAGLPALLGDKEVLRLLAALPPAPNGMEKETHMDGISTANETLAVLKDVRIIRLPPFWVAAGHAMGENPEERTAAMLDDLIEKFDLVNKKPDLRMLGFNNPAAQDGKNEGYERWVSIPDDWQVPAPFVKKRFLGGLYAAHAIAMGAFHEWELLGKWAETSEDYVPDIMTPRVQPYTAEPFADPCLEETLNPTAHLHGRDIERMQLDLLLPIKPKGQ